MNSQRLAEQAGVTYRQLDHWTHRGWLKPVGGTGSGNGRYWPATECQVARAMGALFKYGIPPQLAHDLARNRLAGDVLVILDKLPKEEPASASR